MARTYTLQDGRSCPMKEALHDMPFKIYKTDRPRARQNDPHACVLALGVLRDRDVEECYIGSGGDAFVVFKETEDEPMIAWHFKVKAAARRQVLEFDKNKKATSTQIILSKPPKSWKLDHRDKNNARRRKEVKEGARVKHRGPARKSRMMKFGIRGRPRPKVSRSGSVDTAL